MKNLLLAGIAATTMSFASTAFAKDLLVKNQSGETIVGVFARNLSTNWLSGDLLGGDVIPSGTTAIVWIPNDYCGPWRVGFDAPDNFERKYVSNNICNADYVVVRRGDAGRY
jgi:hypothetical protein